MLANSSISRKINEPFLIQGESVAVYTDRAAWMLLLLHNVESWVKWSSHFPAVECWFVLEVQLNEFISELAV